MDDTMHREASETALKKLNESLEQRVAKRTAALNLLHDVASVANRVSDVEEAMRAVLGRIVQEPPWCIGRVTMTATENGSLANADIQAASDSARLARLRDDTSAVSFAMGVGLVQRAVTKGNGQCVADLLQSPEAAVGNAAVELSVRGAVAFPIVVGQTTVAVVELYSADPIGDPESVLDDMAHVATHLGRVVERKQASRTLWESEERFRLLVSAVEDYAIIMLDTNGHVVSWNAGARRNTGYGSRDILGRHFSCFYTEEDVAAGLPARHLGLASRRGRVAIEGLRVRADGEQYPAEVVITTLRDESGELQGFAKITHDATQRRRLEKEVADATAAEQQRIGQDLHDGLGQELTGLIYQAERLRRQLERASSQQAGAAATLVHGIREALGQVRLLSKGLIPVEVDASGLQTALEELADHAQELHGVTCRFVCKQLVPVEDNNTATQLFRIAQESLTNAVRHAQPTRITVEMSANQTSLEIAVTDDGKGFDATTDAAGSGVRIMRYRAGLIGGQLLVESTCGVGTRVACRVKTRKNGDSRESNNMR